LRSLVRSRCRSRAFTGSILPAWPTYRSPVAASAAVSATRSPRR
jgi:hypothetical protein